MNAEDHLSEPGYAIREAGENDAWQISTLYRRVWDEFETQFPKELKESRQPSEEEMKRWMEQEAYLVAVLKDEVVGVVGCRLMHGTCLLTHMAVDKIHRGKGVGTALVEQVIRYAKENNAFKIWLDTVPFLREAISLYEKFGFRKCGHLRKHLWGLDMELYELILKP
ncbi:MAG: GNAT family N-acetyltransferase [Promethearchaeota archaeon]